MDRGLTPAEELVNHDSAHALCIKDEDADIEGMSGSKNITVFTYSFHRCVNEESGCMSEKEGNKYLRDMTERPHMEIILPKADLKNQDEPL